MAQKNPFHQEEEEEEEVDLRIWSNTGESILIQTYELPLLGFYVR